MENMVSFLMFSPNTDSFRYLVSFGPLLYLYHLQAGHLNWGQFATAFMWPPSQLADFALGVAASSLPEHGPLRFS